MDKKSVLAMVLITIIIILYPFYQQLIYKGAPEAHLQAPAPPSDQKLNRQPLPAIR